MLLSPFLVYIRARSRALSTTSGGGATVEKEQIFGAGFGDLPSSQAPIPRITFVPKPTHNRSGESVGGSSDLDALPGTP
jgi:hypothetical protein